MNNTIVSFENERLICVDNNDNITGYKSKAECHNGEGILHRAFSLFIFNENLQVIMQKRAATKRLWPLIWSNSCCSHPREGETTDIAISRRLFEELGLKAKLHFLYKFQYQARWKNVGSENELCSVYIGKTNKKPEINDTEIAAWHWISRPDLNKDLIENPQKYSPWFKMEWKEIQEKYWTKVESL
jgi:isopentenyl-diphosphate delta-isomerase